MVRASVTVAEVALETFVISGRCDRVGCGVDGGQRTEAEQEETGAGQARWGGLKEQCGWPPVSPRNHPAAILSEMGIGRSRCTVLSWEQLSFF